jgi:hypothetical protein
MQWLFLYLEDPPVIIATFILNAVSIILFFIVACIFGCQNFQFIDGASGYDEMLLLFLPLLKNCY